MNKLTNYFKVAFKFGLKKNFDFLLYYLYINNKKVK